MLLVHFPSPALPGSGRMGMISARFVKAPLMIYSKGTVEKLVSKSCDYNFNAPD